MTVDRRVFGTIDNAVEFHIHYVVRADAASDAKTADFRATALLAAPGAPSEGVFTAVSGAVRLYGRTLAGASDANDEHTRFVSAGDDYDIVYRNIPSSGAPITSTYTLAAVRAAPGAPSAEDFAAVTDFLVSFGDSAAGYVP
ncbi:MAG: hypothetical protein VW362_13200, partial [Candidatus Nanopelagicales bacterium]